MKAKAITQPRTTDPQRDQSGAGDIKEKDLR